MYKVLIVDDDRHVREMLKNIIHWEAFNYHIIGEASDGIEAVEWLDREVIDLLLIDLSMPQMNGIDVIRYIKGAQLPTQIIVLSCHDEFHYVKEAMKFGADEYILKHFLSKEILIEEIVKVEVKLKKYKIEKSQKFKEDKLKKEAERMMKNRLLLSIFKNKVTSGYIDKRVRFYYEELRLKSFGMILIQLPKYHEVEATFNPNGYEILNMVLNNMIREICHSNVGVEFIEIGEGNYILLIPLLTTSSVGILKELAYIVSGVKKTLLNYFGIKSRFVIAADRIPYNQLYLYYVNLMNKSDYLFYENKEIIYNHQYERITDEKIIMDRLKLEGIKATINNSCGDQLIIAIVDYFDKLFAKKIKSVYVKKHFCDVMYWLVNYMGQQLDLSIESTESTVFCEQAKKASTIQVLSSTIKEAAEHIANLMSDNQFEEIENAYIRKAVHYIRTHYNENISLNELANHIHVNSTYLSNLFKTCIDINYVDYVKEVRIRKACNLLKNSNLKIKDIGEAVGVPNRKYFSKTFKHVVGITPQEYKKTH